MDNGIIVPTGRVVGIGKLKVFMTKEFPHEIPTLSFLVAKDEDGNFTATCVNIATDGYGSTPNAAMENMRSHVIDHLVTLFTDERTVQHAWENLRASWKDPFMRDYSDAYKDMQLILAERNISTDIEEILAKRILDLERQIDELKLMAESPSSKIPAVRVVDYQEERAA